MKGGARRDRSTGVPLLGRSLLLLLSLSFLSSCTGKYASIPGTVPGEPAAKSPPEKKRQVSPGFQELKGDSKTAIASWYGPDFHGKPTASGEIFNMYALTCAHREYPFGTKLRVVSAQADKEVECIVNDRGPFIPGRDLDLSYAAARQIELIGPGTQSVSIEPVGRDLRYVKYIRYGVVEGPLTLQIGSFRDESNARRLKRALELRYQDVYVMEANVGGAKYYRVRVGRFTSKADAAGMGRTLAEEGYNVLITKYEQQIEGI
ncbi:MAG: septal ring lytic transglycosylase RlpA family protein [Alphaproteobacteria bacterium]|uniref:Probable endolytic peptidoglycan transglycosylase RlpA n=1 Tax=Candidatus Nitrobium versatile TaxID=2884831 RepID=A0A953JCM8_9BACT|nr:septal ring lytic transglycosylase RlpA family protein [Candidatus Nitrobium versatile]